MPRLRALLPSRSYDVVVERGALARVGDLMAALRAPGAAVVCCDENVAPLYLDTVRDNLRAAGFAVSQLVVPAGERQKNLDRAAEMYGVLYDRGLRRRDVVVALGGGVVGDLAGYVAATYLRGVGLVQVPTTLLAQVDAAVGGKVAVDFRAGKNYVGTFYQPLLVVADLDVLRTLPARELRSGMAEVVKYGLLAGGELLTRVESVVLQWGAGGAAGGDDGSAGAAVASAGRAEQASTGRTDETGGAASRVRGPGALAAAVSEEVVAGCVAAKLAVVERDEREEGGERAVLNLGHTVGHAIEAATGFSRYTHGEAVALGLRAALRLSQRLCALPEADAERGWRLLDAAGLPARLEHAAPALVCELTSRDKKAGGDGVEFVLLEALGRPRLGVQVPAALLEEVVTWLSAP